MEMRISYISKSAENHWKRQMFDDSYLHGTYTMQSCYCLHFALLFSLTMVCGKFPPHLEARIWVPGNGHANERLMLVAS
jgi:hypothetical protein